MKVSEQNHYLTRTPENRSEYKLLGFFFIYSNLNWSVMYLFHVSFRFFCLFSCWAPFVLKSYVYFLAYIDLIGCFRWRKYFNSILSNFCFNYGSRIRHKLAVARNLHGWHLLCMFLELSSVSCICPSQINKWIKRRFSLMLLKATKGTEKPKYGRVGSVNSSSCHNSCFLAF